MKKKKKISARQPKDLHIFNFIVFFFAFNFSRLFDAIPCLNKMLLKLKVRSRESEWVFYGDMVPPRSMAQLFYIIFIFDGNVTFSLWGYSTLLFMFSNLSWLYYSQWGLIFLYVVYKNDEVCFAWLKHNDGFGFNKSFYFLNKTIAYENKFI